MKVGAPCRADYFQAKRITLGRRREPRRCGGRGQARRAWQTRPTLPAKHAPRRSTISLRSWSWDFFRIYGRVIGLLRPERRLAITLAIANVVVASLAYLEPVLFGRIVDVLAKGIDSAGERNLGAEHPAARDLGRRRAGRRDRQHTRLAERRPAGASAPAGGDGAVLRARPQPAARLPPRIALRPGPEDHAGRRRQPVRRLAGLLPRTSGHLHRHI